MSNEEDWVMIKNDNFDEAYSLLCELETAFDAAANAAKWIKLTSFTYEVDPELAFLQNELRNNDIKFTVWNSNLSLINPLMGGATGGVQVMITEPDSENFLFKKALSSIKFTDSPIKQAMD